MIEVREIFENEIAQVAGLEKAVFSDPWSEKGIAETFAQNNSVILGAWQNDQMVGYVIFYYVLDEGEIARIAVSPSCRRTGAATLIFEKLLEVSAEKDITRVMLDVRESNEAAIAFYRKCGFAQDGIRKRFYTGPTEDAILMSMDISK